MLLLLTHKAAACRMPHATYRMPHAFAFCLLFVWLSLPFFAVFIAGTAKKCLKNGNNSFAAAQISSSFKLAATAAAWGVAISQFPCARCCKFSGGGAGGGIER